MAGTRLLTALAAGLMLGMSTAAPVRAAGLELAFSAETLSVSPGKTKPITLLNRTLDTIAIDLRLQGPAAASVSVPAISDPLAPGDSRSITVTAGAATPVDSTVWLIASGRNATGTVVAVAQMPISIVSASTAKVAVAKWTAISYRNRWPLSSARTRRIPFKGITQCPAELSKETHVGTVVNGGLAARVLAKCVPADTRSKDTAPLAELRFDGVGSASGDYSGTIDLLLSDDKAGEVELTVRRTDGPFWPFVAIVIGIVAALVLTHFRNRGRAIRAALAQALEAAVSARRIDGQFRALPPSASWRTYSIARAVDAKVEEIRTRLRKLEVGLAEIKDDEFKATKDELDALEAAIASWEAIPPKLRTLSEAAPHIGAGADVIDPPTAGLVPVLRSDIAALLAGKAVTAFDELATIAADVNAVLAVAPMWTKAGGALKMLDGELERLEALVMEEDDKRERSRLHREVGELASRLYRDAAAALADLATAVDALGHEVDGLSRRYPVKKPDVAPMGAAEADTTARPVVAASMVEPEVERAGVLWAIRLGDFASLAIAAVVAIWAALTAVYFDKAVGTPRDYATLVMWALGAQALVSEGLTIAADRLMRGTKAS